MTTTANVLDRLTLPGECPTLFVGSRCHAGHLGLCLRWKWLEMGGMDPAARDLIGDPAVEDAFHDSAAIVREVCGRAPGGLRLMPEDLVRVRQEGSGLVGGSLGLALLLGALGWVLQRPWPRRWVAWGLFEPARLNRWSLVPTGTSAAKALLARELGASAMLHPAADRVPGPPFPLSVPLVEEDALEVTRGLAAWLLGERALGGCLLSGWEDAK